MHTLFQDLRYSLRQLVHNPGFALAAVVSLALGIGAAVAVFSVVWAGADEPVSIPRAGSHGAHASVRQGWSAAFNRTHGAAMADHSTCCAGGGCVHLGPVELTT